MKLKTRLRSLGRPHTQKELLTWKLLVQGLTAKAIVNKRRIASGTIDSVRSVLMSKLGARRSDFD